MKCALSEVECQECEENPSCQIYSERYVLKDQLKKLRKTLGDSLTIIDSILKKKLCVEDAEKP